MASRSPRDAWVKSNSVVSKLSMAVLKIGPLIIMVGNMFGIFEYINNWKHICVLKQCSGDQYPQCWPNIHFIGPVSYTNITTFTGLSLDILKMESWTHMGRTANIIIKSPRYTGGDFMFLYRFVWPRPQILVHAITFEQLFGFLSFLARLLALTCRLPD